VNVHVINQTKPSKKERDWPNGTEQIDLKAPSISIPKNGGERLLFAQLSRTKATALKALATNSIADPDLAAASGPALRAILQSISQMETACETSTGSISSFAKAWILKPCAGGIDPWL
jgi:hypothetical protein